jgi:myo-inositol-1(or 4)-monophosphatase
MSQCAGVRRPGAAALDLAYVAAGYADGFFETGLKPWDVAAGSLLVTEAGGLIGNFTGEADFMDQGECVAGNPRIYAQLVNALGKYSKFAGVANKLQISAEFKSSTEGEASGEALAPVAKPVLKARKLAASEGQAGAAPVKSVKPRASKAAPSKAGGAPF